MASRPLGWVAFATAFAVSLLFQTSTVLAGPEDTVRQRVAELNRQLGQGPNAIAWNKFLDLPELQQQVAAGPNADRAKVEALLVRFSGTEKGLDWAPIVAVRQSLSAWLEAFPPPPVADLPKLLRDAKSRYAGRDAAVAESGRREVRAAYDRLSRYLAGGAQGPGWRAFLYLDALDTQLKSPTPDVAELRGIQRQFVSGKVGLELPIFANVGRSLGDYIDRLATTDSPAVREEYAKKLEILAEGLEKLAKEPTTDVSDAFSWLTASGQVTPVLAAVRHYYSRPNLRVQVSEALMASTANREVDDVSPVFDNILGTRISGTGHTRGRVALEFVPDQQRAIYDLLFSGNVSSTTVGRNGPAVIHSRGGTAFNARKRILLDSKGITQLGTQTAARTSTTTTGVGVTINIPIVKGFAQKMAAQQVAKKKGQGEYIGARHAESRISRQFDQKVAQNLNDTNRNFQDVVVLPAQRYGRAPDQLRFSTSDQAMFVVGLHANRNQLAAPSDPPAIATPDLAVRFHESALNNMAEGFAGQTWQDEEIKRDLGKYVKLPAKWNPEPGEEAVPGTITFADEKPLTLTVADGAFTLTIRAQQFTRGEKVHDLPMDISVTYKFEKGPDGIVAKRVGDLKVRPPGFESGKDKMSIGQTTLVKLLEKTFGKIFSTELKTTIEPEKGDIGKLVAQSATAEKGWLAIDWQQVKTGQVAGQPPRKLAVAE